MRQFLLQQRRLPGTQKLKLFPCSKKRDLSLAYQLDRLKGLWMTLADFLYDWCKLMMEQIHHPHRPGSAGPQTTEILQNKEKVVSIFNIAIGLLMFEAIVGA